VQPGQNRRASKGRPLAEQGQSRPPFVRVLVVDDHPSLLFALRTVINAESDLRVVGEEATLGGALRRVRDDPPDVVLLDLGLPDAEGAKGIRLLLAARPGLPVVVLTGTTDRPVVDECLEAGAAAYLVKTAAVETLPNAIRRAARGESVIDLTLVGDPRRALAQLTVRELDVLEGVAEGLTNAQIAARLGISPDTVKTHLSHAMGKLGAADRAHAVAILMRRGALR
jgi:DNA-binding NarL/FixJ family response regulator